jgi:hypothetical protein
MADLQSQHPFHREPDDGEHNDNPTNIRLGELGVDKS